MNNNSSNIKKSVKKKTKMELIIKYNDNIIIDEYNN